MDDVEMVDAATVGEEQCRKQIQGVNSTGAQEEKSPSTATQDLRGFTVVAQANTKNGQTRTSGIVPHHQPRSTMVEEKRIPAPYKTEHRTQTS